MAWVSLKFTFTLKGLKSYANIRSFVPGSSTRCIPNCQLKRREDRKVIQFQEVAPSINMLPSNPLQRYHSRSLIIKDLITSIEGPI